MDRMANPEADDLSWREYFDTETTRPLSVAFRGVLATEIRRVARNLQLSPQAFVRIMMAEGLKDKYGIIIK